MKRVKAACICQTLHFMLKEDGPQDYAVKRVREEVTHYKSTLERNHTQYKILEETAQPDGSGIIQIIKQGLFIFEIEQARICGLVPEEGTKAGIPLLVDGGITDFPQP